MSRPFLIVEAGQPLASLRRHRGFPHWIRVAAGLHAGDAVAVNVEAGESLPPHEQLADGAYAGVIVTGSAAMVTDRADWSETSAAWLREAAQAGQPLLAICYGHQLLAHALGGEVGDHPGGREMGTVDITLHPAAGDDPLFAALPGTFAAQATHMQTVLRAPQGAQVLAKSDHDACQAFRWGECAWGVQFHPEFSTTHMRGYIDARRVVLQREGRCPRTLVHDVRATPHARRLLRRFVHHARGLAR
ncbi:glutamine amidotransferase [Lysobacter sp. D1-1-M9]|uniref:glutamine amidotransferase n=1 Tax=Novilysobacter longmucuonensis TaxID=3098603 RepID=UPI002FCA2124